MTTPRTAEQATEQDDTHDTAPNGAAERAPHLVAYDATQDGRTFVRRHTSGPIYGERIA